MNKTYSVVKNRNGNMTVASEIAKGAKKGRVVGVVATLLIATLSGHNANAASVTTGSFTTTTNTDCYTSPSSGDGYGFNCPSVQFSFDDTFATTNYVNQAIANATQTSTTATAAVSAVEQDVADLKASDAQQNNDISALQGRVTAVETKNSQQDTAIGDLQANKADKSYVDAQNRAQDSVIAGKANTSDVNAKNQSQDIAIQANTDKNATQDSQISALQANKADKTSLDQLQAQVNGIKQVDVSGLASTAYVDAQNQLQNTAIAQAQSDAKTANDTNATQANQISALQQADGVLQGRVTAVETKNGQQDT
ncbi:hypothetical protein EOL70_30870, partial [Leucothrix sargassi]